MNGKILGMVCFGVLVLGLGSVSTAFAYEGRAEGAAGPPESACEAGQDCDALRSERRARIALKIEAVHAAHVSSALELTAEEGAVVLPVLRAIQRERHAAHRSARKAHDALSAAVRQGDDDLESLRKAVIRARESERLGEKKLVEGLCAVLSPRKCALFTLEAPRLEREVRRAVRELRKGPRGPRNRRGLRGPRGRGEGQGRPRGPRGPRGHSGDGGGVDVPTP